MNANEIQNSVLLGSHSNVKEFLAPLIARISEMMGWAPVQVRYDGCGGVAVVLCADDCASTKACWDAIWTAAKAVRRQLPESEFRVTKPHRAEVDGGTFRIVRDSFSVKVR